MIRTGVRLGVFAGGGVGVGRNDDGVSPGERVDRGGSGKGNGEGPAAPAGGRGVGVNVPFVVSVEGLRGLPGARSAGVLAAYACQPHQDLSGSVRGPAAECVERFGAARRLEGWSVWLQVFEAARLARYWDGHPFDADPAAGVDCGGYWNAVEAADPALYERLVGQLNLICPAVSGHVYCGESMRRRAGCSRRRGLLVGFCSPARSEVC